MTTYVHNYARVSALIFVVVTGAIFKWLQWRSAKVSGISRSQFAEMASRPGEKELSKAQWFRLSGWILILFPFFAAALSEMHHRDSPFMLIGEIGLLEIFFGGLGWFMLWMASQCRERARQMGAAL
ncbi:hypothetical protein BWP39_17120 [Paraburkholderia acidicola]|uniref:Transmembrane protein n=1 Tax=Paraburkholderia acidicola TaxID=1912599 RepID=A0A2A4F0Y6_9BURK|nr:hypothetical protein BWP39_17120 [Paraburkholderia acidicola]